MRIRGSAVRTFVVRRQSERYAMHMPLEIFAGGRKLVAELEDLSRTGMFIRVEDPPPEGTLVHVAFTSAGQRFVTSGHVMHSLDETDARSLGRRVGIGIEFRLATRSNDQLFAGAVERMLEHYAKPPLAAEHSIIVATSHVRLLERLSSAFGEAGWAVATAANGLEAVAACLRTKPDVLLVERTLPIIDGLDVVERIAQNPKLAGMPMIVMSEDPRDGIQAFELGAMDFVTKPFSTAELVLRVRRLVRGPGTVVFSGDLAEIPLPALLTMFELERKSGQLALHRPSGDAWIDLEDGRIVNARSTEDPADPRTVVMHLLDWTTGSFELSTSRDTELPPCDLALSITHLLLEHARQRDEARRLMAM
jgi:DNA-binding response OmpR family regulator